MNQLMHDEVVKTFARLFGKFRVEPDGAASVVAAAPFGLHVLDEEALDRDPESFLPSGDHWRGGLFEAAAVPFVHERPFHLVSGAGSNREKEPMVFEFDAGGHVLLSDD